MATFAKATFAASSYAAFRPTYPSSLYNVITAYHQGPKNLVVDLGAGTGIATRAISSHFARAIGTEPSAGMIAQAQEKSRFDPKLEFRQASAEHLPFLADNSVDCVIAAQAAHWFDYAKLWPELRRVLRRDGTMAFFGYKDFVFVDYPKASEIMQHYSYDPHPEKLGSYWQQPGRSYVQDKLRVIQPPTESFADLQRVEYEPGLQGRHSGQGTMFMEKRITVGECKEYLRTWSSYHGWQETHPDQQARNKGGQGDIADQIFDEIAQTTEDFRDEAHEIDVEWGSGLVMARKL